MDDPNGRALDMHTPQSIMLPVHSRIKRGTTVYVVTMQSYGIVVSCVKRPLYGANKPDNKSWWVTVRFNRLYTFDENETVKII